MLQRAAQCCTEVQGWAFQTHRCAACERRDPCDHPRDQRSQAECVIWIVEPRRYSSAVALVLFGPIHRKAIAATLRPASGATAITQSGSRSSCSRPRVTAVSNNATPNPVTTPTTAASRTTSRAWCARSPRLVCELRTELQITGTTAGRARCRPWRSRRPTELPRIIRNFSGRFREHAQRIDEQLVFRGTEATDDRFDLAATARRHLSEECSSVRSEGDEYLAAAFGRCPPCDEPFVDQSVT